MFEFTTQIRVRYAETDQMGYVYYGNYSTYYEVARVEALRSLGITYKQVEEKGILMPIVENKSKYISPAFYDDLLTIKLYVRTLPDRRMNFDYEFFNEQGKLIHIGETTLAFYDVKLKKAVHTPEYLLQLFNQYFTNAQTNPPS